MKNVRWQILERVAEDLPNIKPENGYQKLFKNVTQGYVSAENLNYFPQCFFWVGDDNLIEEYTNGEKREAELYVGVYVKSQNNNQGIIITEAEIVLQDLIDHFFNAQIIPKQFTSKLGLIGGYDTKVVKQKNTIPFASDNNRCLVELILGIRYEEFYEDMGTQNLSAE